MAEPFDAVDVIVAKRDGRRLTDQQIDWVVDAYTRGVVADEQMSALAMAILLNGMSREEIARWTGAMIASGERLDFSGLGRPTADKHSTGGVGDKITLPLAPLVAVFGVAVPQLSGRGLGHTGGTLDKLETIPGWRAALTNDEMLAQLRDVVETLALAPPRELFTRCMLDNVPLVVVPDALAWPHLPEGVRGVASPVRQCPECGRFYWNGSHVRRMRHALERALPGWLGAPPP